MHNEEPRSSRIEKQRGNLVQYNSGEWESIFIRIGSNRRELERFPCHLSVFESNDLIQANLTYKQSGKIARSAFRDIPESMQIEPGGHWSLGPQYLTQEFWTTEFCLCRPQERRRAVIRQSRSWLESIVVIIEWREGSTEPPITLASPHPLGLQESSQSHDPKLEVLSNGAPLGLSVAISNTPEQQATTWSWGPQSITRRYDAANQLVPSHPED